MWLLSTYIQGETQFPKFSCTTALDDITVGYYNSERYIPKGNTTNEDDVIGSDYIKGISDDMYNSFVRRSALFRESKYGFLHDFFNIFYLKMQFIHIQIHLYDEHIDKV